jgi:ABC-2 type transport system permease protein
MKTRLLSLIRKEFIQTRRDVAIVILVLYTFAETVLCGWSLTMDVKHIPTAVLDRDNSPASRALVARFRAVESFKLAAMPLSEAELDRLLDTGQVTLGLVIPPDLGRDLAAGRPTALQALADGTQPNAALLSLAYVRQIVRSYSSEIEVARLDQAGLTLPAGWWPTVANQVRAWYLPELRYVHFGMVSMVAIAVVQLGMIQAAAGFVREKEAGTLEQLLVTPIRPIELILAKLIPLVVLEVLGLAVGVALGYLVFGVGPHARPAATLLLFFALSTLAFLASAGLGIWIATVAHTFQQALLLAFFILFPMLFLSGTIVPITVMPIWLQWLSFISPMRHYLTIALNLFLKGVGLQVVWPHVALLAGFTVAIVGIGLARFRRSLA